VSDAPSVGRFKGMEEGRVEARFRIARARDSAVPVKFCKFTSYCLASPDSASGNPDSTGDDSRFALSSVASISVARGASLTTWIKGRDIPTAFLWLIPRLRDAR
jgi:hypothetical protein